MSDNPDPRFAFLLLGAVVVGVVGLLGAFVGASASEAGSPVVVFGLVALPTSPAAVAAYGVVLATVLVGLLYAAVSITRRYDPDAVTRSQ